MIGAILYLSVLAQERPPLAAVVREVPGDGAKGLRPKIVCDGTADLPDGSRLDLRIYYGPREPGRELQYRSVRVRNGGFSADFAPFPERILSGRYEIRIEFPPTLVAHTAPFRIGTPRDGEEDRARVYQRLAEDIRAIVAMADDPARRHRQAWAVVERACTSPEYRALRVQPISGAGLRDLWGRLRALASAQGEAARGARTAFDRLAGQLLDRVAAEQPGSEALKGRVEEMRAKLRGVPLLTGDALDRSRKEFTADLLGLQAKAPARHHSALVGLASGAEVLFDEGCPGGERERKFRREVEPILLELVEETKRSRWE